MVVQDDSFVCPESTAILAYLATTQSVPDHWYPGNRFSSAIWRPADKQELDMTTTFLSRRPTHSRKNSSGYELAPVKYEAWCSRLGLQQGAAAEHGQARRLNSGRVELANPHCGPSGMLPQLHFLQAHYAFEKRERVGNIGPGRLLACGLAVLGRPAATQHCRPSHLH